MNTRDEEIAPQIEHPAPVLRKMRWPYPLIWLVPTFAAVLAGYYFYDRIADRGPEITIHFSDATGLNAAETKVVHRGVQIGQVTAIMLSSDQGEGLVRVRLRKSQARFAKSGSQFWVVKAEISLQSVSGLGTILSGPVIDSAPGDGPPQGDFIALQKPPVPAEDGLLIVLKTARLDHLQSDSPINFKGIQIGKIQSIRLSGNAATVEVHVLIEKRYAPLVKTYSRFWVDSAVDLKGGLFSGLQLKVESLRALLTGGIAMATPEEKWGDQAENNAVFLLYDEPKKEWLTWSPKIAIQADASGSMQGNPALPQPPQAIRTSVEPNP